MKNKFSVIFEKAIFYILLLTAVLVPLLFFNGLTEFYEMPKVIIVVVIAALLLVLWAFSWVLQGKMLITKTPLDLPLLLLLAVVILSAIFSPLRNISIYGNLPKLHGSAASLVAYIVIFFVAASHLRSIKQVKLISYAITISGALIALITTFAYFAPNLIPFQFGRFANFTPTGSSFSTGALLTLLLPLPLLSLLSSGSAINRIFPNKLLALILTTLFMATIALIGSNTIYLIAFVVLVITLIVVKEPVVNSLRKLLVPLAVCATLLILGLIPSVGAVKNPISEKRVNFPREITLSFPISWKVAISSFRDSPFLGSGPSTYLFDFTAYKPAEHNQTRFWNLRFDSAHNEFLQVLATLGGLGLLTMVFFAASIVLFSWADLFPKNRSSEQDVLSQFLAISALTSVMLLALHVSTVVSLVTSFILLAMLMAVHRSGSGNVEDLAIGIKASKRFSDLSVGDLGSLVEWIGSVYFIVIFVFLPLLAVSLITIWNIIPFVRADLEHRAALNAASSNGIETYNHLVAAEKLNPYVDLYRLDLAQTNFAIANQIAAQKGPTEASPSGSLTDADKTNIQQLLSQSINEGRAAVTLNPYNAANWEILGSIYRQISGVAQNAISFAVDSYGRAIQRDPLNPLLRLNVGGIYYSVKSYDLAIRFFQDAINLKPDFANGYFNLSVAYRDKGDLRSAVAAATQVVSLLDPKSNDYKAASDYLKDLNDRLASESAKQRAAAEEAKSAQLQETNNLQNAGKETSNLQKENIPVKLDLPKPDSIATPSAVPAPSPSPSTE